MMMMYGRPTFDRWCGGIYSCISGLSVSRISRRISHALYMHDHGPQKHCLLNFTLNHYR